MDLIDSYCKNLIDTYSSTLDTETTVSNYNNANQDYFEQELPIFNGTYYIIEELDNGTTARIYLCQSIYDKKEMVALKLFKKSYIENNENSRLALSREVSILANCEHKNIIKFHEFGSNGKLRSLSGDIVSNLVYVIMEYFPGETLYNYIKRYQKKGLVGIDE